MSNEERRQSFMDILHTANREKIWPLVEQMAVLISDAFKVGFEAGVEAGRYVDYTKTDEL